MLYTNGTTNSNTNITLPIKMNISLYISNSPFLRSHIEDVLLRLFQISVMIEAVIAEVTTGANAELGVQWRATDVTSANDEGVVGGTSHPDPVLHGVDPDLAVAFLVPHPVLVELAVFEPSPHEKRAFDLVRKLEAVCPIQGSGLDGSAIKA